MVRFGKKIDYFPLFSTNIYVYMCIYIYAEKN